MKTPSTAIFDLGKTNKKFFLFDEDMNPVYEISERFSLIKDEDGEDCENLDALTSWMYSSLNEQLANQKFDIKYLNFSTYGASFVHINQDGKPITPLYDYLKPISEELWHRFYRTYGPQEQLSLETASPPLVMLNSGLQLFWLKYARPNKFEQTKYSLHLPQYCSYLFTGAAVSEMTSIGCHTALWNYQKGTYHHWVYSERIVKKLPAIVETSGRIHAIIDGNPVKTGIGIHDSSAALVPYLRYNHEPFMLISTGTWSISLNPFNTAALTPEELRKDGLCFMNYLGKPVKAARLFMGREHEFQVERLARHFGKPETYYTQIKLDSALLELPQACSPFVPAKMQGTGPRPEIADQEWRLEGYETYESAYHQLMKGLVDLQIESFQLAKGNTPIKRVYIDGGFTKNSIFTGLLAEKLHEIDVYTAEIPQASAIGAALIVNNSHPELSNAFRKVRSSLDF